MRKYITGGSDHVFAVNRPGGSVLGSVFHCKHRCSHFFSCMPKNSITDKPHILQGYRVIALILGNIVPSRDIEGRELASVRSYPSEGQYSPISVR